MSWDDSEIEEIFGPLLEAYKETVDRMRQARKVLGGAIATPLELVPDIPRCVVEDLGAAGYVTIRDLLHFGEQDLVRIPFIKDTKIAAMVIDSCNAVLEGRIGHKH